MTIKYNHREVEKKTREMWEASLVKNKIEEKKKGKEKIYLLDMFPYPSAYGIHMGHTYTGALTDAIYKFKTMKGFDVLHPQGFDAFGLPAENFAIKTGIHPKETTKKAMNNIKKQFFNMGIEYTFLDGVITSSEKYYKWTQYIFGKFFENNLVYRKNTKANWCDSCKTVIANEQVVAGKCERCKNEIIQKDIASWMFKITDFSEELIDDLDKLDWPEFTKKNQKNWIGKSSGAEINFNLVESEYIDINKDGGKDTYQNGVEEIERYNVVVVIEHPEKDEFLCVKWKKVDWQGFVTGGIESGDTVESTALKEVIEETGYQNPEIVKVYEQSSHGKFYHVGKKVNRFAHYRIVHVKLKDLEQKERAIEEQDITDIVWVPKSEVSSFLKREDMRYPWRVVNGENNFKEKLKVFTTRADTIFGVTYMVVAPENKIVKNFLESGKIQNPKEVQEYIEKTNKKTELERIEAKEKTGVKLKGISAINPANKKEVPVFISDYVLDSYATGAVMAVPAHDLRDNEFAKKFNLEIIEVIESKNKIESDIFTGEGVLINSGEFNGLKSKEAVSKIVNFVEGEIKLNFRLRDWSISRQRYWGTPIPIVYTPDGIAKFVGEENLPWKLTEDVDFLPDGVAPLGKSKELKERTERIFGKGYKPEIDTMDTFVDSSWYFLRYPDSENEDRFCSKEKLKEFLPVDLYIGGAEHTYMHLLYARFFIKAMKKIGLVDFDEPFLKLRHQGMICDKEGKKMSKSKGNVVNPDEVVERFGADATRLYLLFSSPVEDDVIWNEDGVVGTYRFIEKVCRQKIKTVEEEILEVKKELAKTCKKFTQHIEDMKFNTAISFLMSFINFLDKQEKINKQDFEDFLKMLSIFAPFVSDSLAEKNLILEDWPEFDSSLIKEDVIEIIIQVNGKKRVEMKIPFNKNEEEIKKMVLENKEVLKWVEESEIKRIIYVKGKLVSIVI